LSANAFTQAPYLSSLNPEQLEAVLHEGSPLLILAGAGTGKTRVITTKIAYLVRERGFAPESILAVTFTNKAAKEMRERAAMIEPSCERSVIRTFHSFGAWFLRRNAQAAGLESNFIIYDDEDSANLLHAALPSIAKQDCSRYATMIARAKDYALEPSSPKLQSFFHDEEFRRIFQAYEDRLHSTGNVDFGDLIGLPSRILNEEEGIAQRTRQRFRVILVDEYQDSNVAQFQLLQRLTDTSSYICVVGDDDQSIYRFRGAEVKNILSFSNSFPGTKIIRLERNYRSYQSILDIAGNIVSHNSGRLGKTLRATKPGGVKPQIALLDDQEQEVEFCARLIRQHRHDGGSLADIAILYRTNAQSLSFEKSFPRKAIPYKIVGSLRFYDREEVKDILAYLALVLNPKDEIAFRRIINKPTRGLGEGSIDTIMQTAIRGHFNLIEASRASIDSMRGKGVAGLERFLGILHQARMLLVEPRESQAPLSMLLETIVADSGLAEFHSAQDEISGTQKLSNMDELISASSLYSLSFEGLSTFLETIELDRSLQREGEERDAVSLITMHNTKGLEFPIVIVTGLEQGLFPRDDDEGESLEEQRRLFYVSATRAKSRLVLTACRWRRIRGRLIETTPSRFLLEIDPALYEFWKGGVGSSFPKRFAPPRSHESAKPYQAQHSTREPGTPSGWKTGQAVYHDEFGQGVITKTSETENSGTLVTVMFESGKNAQFFPKYTKKLEKLKE
jgi:DNA helicase-2/ATP-dependent DNA helicase PcrA